MKKPIINFSRLSIKDLINKARLIVLNMTGNLHFATPDPALAVVTTITDTLEAKNLAAQTGGKLAYEEMMVERKNLEMALRSLGLYVDKIANGDMVVLSSSSFDITKDATPHDEDDFWVERGPFPGEILVGCVAFAKARAYAWQFGYVEPAPVPPLPDPLPDPMPIPLPPDNSGWMWAGVSTQRKMTITNLPIGGQVWVRYSAVTPGGMSPWSDAISIVVG